MNGQYQDGTVDSDFGANGRMSYQHVQAPSHINYITSSGHTDTTTLPPIAGGDYDTPMSGTDLLRPNPQQLRPSFAAADHHTIPQHHQSTIYPPSTTNYYPLHNPVNGYHQPGPQSLPYRTQEQPFTAAQPRHSYQHQHQQTQQHQQQQVQQSQQSQQSSQTCMLSTAPRSARLPDIKPGPIRPPSMFLEEHPGPNSHGTPPGSAVRATDDLGSNRPSHVVGSQGRRGVLPATTGNTLPAGVDGTTKASEIPIPPKDANGKFPCPQCSKTYLHAKHLKRHMLRHSGCRPYSCGLCKDTFSRSDILKRHFAKCESRRGNPTGENHLTLSRETNKLRAKQEAENLASAPHSANPIYKSEPSPTDVQPTSNGFPPVAYDQTLDLRDLDVNANPLLDQQRPTLAPMSRSNSLKKTSRDSSHRGSLSTVPPSSFDPTGLAYNAGHVTPDSITTSGAATPYTYPPEVRSHQISPDGPQNRSSSGAGLGGIPTSRPSVVSHYSTGSLPHIVGQPAGGANGFDWSNYGQFPSQEDLNHPTYSTAGLHHPQIKQEMEFNLPPHVFHFPKDQFPKE